MFSDSKKKDPRFWKKCSKSGGVATITGQYPLIKDSDIIQTSNSDPLGALLMVTANATLKDAEQQASGKKQHQPSFHESGWSIAIETKQGIIGLWSCWLGNQFYLGYPKHAEFQNQENLHELIMEILEVELSHAVKNTRFGARQWAKFFGPQLSENKGRVWIDQADFNSNGHSFYIVRPEFSEGFETVQYGHNSSRSIFTSSFSFFNEEEPEAPNASPEAIQPYRDRFLMLASEIARLMSDASAVNIDYGFVLVPEQLTTLGYENIKWLKGKQGVREGWGHEVVYAEKTTATGKESVILKSGNTLVPWSTIRRITCTPPPTADELFELLTF